MKTKPSSRVTAIVSMLWILCIFQVPERITSAITPNTVAAQVEHIEISSYQWGCGLIPDQTLRISVSDPNQLQQRNEPRGPARARVRLLLADGSIIRQSPEFLIPEGGFNFIDFRRVDLPVAGDSITGRVQVLAEVFVFVQDPRSTGLSLVSGEIINATTGQTLVYGGFSGGVTVASGDVN